MSVEGEAPGDPNCICNGTGIVTRLSTTTASGNTGPEVCECVGRKAADLERERVREAHDWLNTAAFLVWLDEPYDLDQGSRE